MHFYIMTRHFVNLINVKKLVDDLNLSSTSLTSAGTLKLMATLVSKEKKLIFSPSEKNSRGSSLDRNEYSSDVLKFLRLKDIGVASISSLTLFKMS